MVQLSFQEACDDPNAYCYLWTVRGGLSRNDSTGNLDHPVAVFGPPSATMFSLCYDEKVWLPEYGHFYKVSYICLYFNVILIFGLIQLFQLALEMLVYQSINGCLLILSEIHDVFDWF